MKKLLTMAVPVLILAGASGVTQAASISAFDGMLGNAGMLRKHSFFGLGVQRHKARQAALALDVNVVVDTVPDYSGNTASGSTVNQVVTYDEPTNSNSLFGKAGQRVRFGRDWQDALVPVAEPATTSRNEEDFDKDFWPKDRGWEHGNGGMGGHGFGHKYDYELALLKHLLHGPGSFDLNLSCITDETSRHCTAEWHREFGGKEVPIPATAWLMGSGLMGLVGMARRRRSIGETTVDETMLDQSFAV